MNYTPTEKTTVKRLPKRASYDKKIVQSILGEGMIAHVGLETDTGVVVIPMAYGFDEFNIFLHGSPSSRLLRKSDSNQICVTVTVLDGLVLARSLFHHSMNYRSVVIMGSAEKVDSDSEKERALDLIVENIIPGRTEGTRPNSAKEIKSTTVIKLPINEVSAKIRTGPPVDDEEDYALKTWAGVIPIKMSFGEPEPDPLLEESIEIPAHVSNLLTT